MGRRRPSVTLAANRDGVLRIAAEHGATEVQVFGSVARGEDTADSDVDLLVTLVRGTTLLDLAAMTDALEDLLGVHVDVISVGGLDHRHDSIRTDARPL